MEAVEQALRRLRIRRRESQIQRTGYWGPFVSLRL